LIISPIHQKDFYNKQQNFSILIPEMEYTKPFELKTILLPNGETYAYRDVGISEKVLILLHGNFTTSFFFEPFIEKIAASFRIIAPDLRGYGHTTYNTPINSLEDLCDDLKQFIEVLELQKVNLLGWSASGPVAQLFACKYPDLLQGLILVASVGPRGTMIKNEQAKFMKEKEDFDKSMKITGLVNMIYMGDTRMIRWFIENAGFQNINLPESEMIDKYVQEVKLQRNLTDMFCALNNFNISDETNGICAGTKQIKEIKGRCLLIHGSHDENVKCLNSWEIKRYLVKNADIEIIEGARHFLFEPKTVDKMTQIIQDFILSS